MHISVCALATTEESLKFEIDIAKAALLYGDTVTLYSPKLQQLLELEEVRNASVEEVADRALSMQSLTAAQRQFYKSVRERYADAPPDIRAALNQVLQQAMAPADARWLQMGGAELAVATDAGVLNISPMLNSNHADVDELLDELVTAVQSVVDARTTYPLFDETFNAFIRDRSIARKETSIRRGREVGLASGLTVRLPSFPNANMSEILAIREELGGNLGAFRTAIRQMSKELAGISEGEDFSDAVDEIWFSVAAPALDQLREKIAQDTSLRSLVLNPLNTATAPSAGIVSLALTQSPAIAAAIAASLLTSNIFSEKRARDQRRQSLTQSDFYFLHAADRRMGNR
jgi:hypothetical protein